MQFPSLQLVTETSLYPFTSSNQTATSESKVGYGEGIGGSKENRVKCS